MSEFSQILDAVRSGDSDAANQLLPLVYDELRALAAQKMSEESPGQTLQATALVHEVYLRLVGSESSWDSRRHFFSAAALAMRRILVDNARRKRRAKRGGDGQKVQVENFDFVIEEPAEDLVALNDALEEFAEQHPAKAELVNLRYFAGFSNADAARSLDISPATADRHWAYARAWLYQKMKDYRRIQEDLE